MNALDCDVDRDRPLRDEEDEPPVEDDGDGAQDDDVDDAGHDQEVDADQVHAWKGERKTLEHEYFKQLMVERPLNSASIYIKEEVCGSQTVPRRNYQISTI